MTVSKLSWRGFRRSWELYPLAACVGVWAVGMSAMVYWQMNTRDIKFNKRRKFINERVSLLHPWPLKLIVPPGYPKPLPELHNIYQQMKAEEDKRKREADALKRSSKKKTRRST